MELTEAEKVALKSIFKKYGFSHFESGRYCFHKDKTSSRDKFLKILGVPDSFKNSPELKGTLYLSFLEKTLSQYYSSIDNLAVEWSDENGKGDNYRTAPKTSSTMSKAEDKLGVSTSEYVRSLVPAINIGVPIIESLVLLDPAKNDRPVFDIDPNMYLALTNSKIHDLIMDDSVLKVGTTFDPYTLESLFVKETKRGSLVTWHVNYYVPPRWRFVKAPAKFGGFIKTLIDHLFPVELEKEYVLDWLHYAVAFRNDTVLCLIGSRGTGKGILLNSILTQLIGEEYREIVNQEILTEKFNSAFKNRRYVFFDEVDVSGDRELNKFKAFCNTTIALEGKGTDSETIDNFTSLGLSSNNKKDFRAEPQERRFSVPEVTEIPLVKVVSEMEIDSFCKRIAEPTSVEISEFGEFLLARKPKNTSRTPLRGAYFFNLCKLSMPEWKTFIIEYFIHEGVIGEEVRNSHLVKKFKKIHGEQASFATKRGSIETFVGDYFHMGQCRIGRVVDSWDNTRARDTFAIIPDEDFLRKFGNNYNNNNDLDAL